MSGPALTAAQLNPQPERWGAMRAGNIDSRSRDTTPDLSQINDAIQTASCSIQRRDRLPMTSQDLAWTGATSVDVTGRIVSITMASGDSPGLTLNNPIDYLVTITVQTNGGRVLSWDAFQLVVAQTG